MAIPVTYDQGIYPLEQSPAPCAFCLIPTHYWFIRSTNNTHKDTPVCPWCSPHCDAKDVPSREQYDKAQRIIKLGKISHAQEKSVEPY